MDKQQYGTLEEYLIVMLEREAQGVDKSIPWFGAAPILRLIATIRDLETQLAQERARVVRASALVEAANAYKEARARRRVVMYELIASGVEPGRAGIEAESRVGTYVFSDALLAIARDSQPAHEEQVQK